MKTAVFKIWRGDANGGNFAEFSTEISEGMVVLDAVHDIQAKQANDLACRWNCKAGKCGSCSAEINGVPKLMCMTRLDAIPIDKPVTIEPMRAFPCIRDLVTELLGVSPRFAQMWAAHDVEIRRPLLKRIDHPLSGPVEFECQILHVSDTGQRLIVYCAAPGSVTQAAFRRLAAQLPVRDRNSGRTASSRT